MRFKQMMRTQRLIAGIGLALCTGSSAFAQNGDAILDMLVKKGVINQREANEAREQADAQNSQMVSTFNKVKTSNWLSAMTLSGDYRLRAEYNEYENYPSDPSVAGYSASKVDHQLANDRLRWRMRLRVGAEMQMQDWATVGVRLSTGGQANSKGITMEPESPNQTMTDTFSRKSIGIDLAYVAIQAPNFDYIKLYGGKMPNPIWQPKFASPMVYDNDINPEGIAEQLQYKFGDKEQYRVFATAGQYAVSESSSDANDVYMYDQQIGFEGKFNDHLKATVAIGYLATSSVPTLTLTNATPTDASANKGNATGGDISSYIDDFNIIYGRGELAWTINDKTFLGTPNIVTVSGEWLANTSNKYADLNGANTTKDKNQRQGYSAQFMYGADKKQGNWSVAYQYKVLEADATWDAITDSDWGPNGTDRRGHFVNATYNIRDWWTLRAGVSLTEKITDRPNATAHNQQGFNGEQMFRAQFDTIFKF